MYTYADFDEKQLFRGTINRLLDIHSQEFIIEQTDKTVAFQHVFEKSVTYNAAKERVFKMAKVFVKRGRTKQNVRTHQEMDRQIKEPAKGAASKVGKKKYGYIHNPDETLCGMMLLVYKMMLDCRSRNAPQRQR